MKKELEEFNAVKFHLNNVKKSYDKIMKEVEGITTEITITKKDIMLEEKNSCGDTLISYDFVNFDFSGMIGYLDFHKLSDFMHFIQQVEIAIAVDLGITVKYINKWLKGEI